MLTFFVCLAIGVVVAAGMGVAAVMLGTRRAREVGK